MDSSLLPVLFVVGVAVVVLVAVLGFLAEKKRRELLQRVAASRGWRYTRRDDAWAGYFGGSPFGRGHNRQAHNILTGVHDGRDFVGFDYLYHTTETSTDAQGHTTSREVSHWFSVLALRTADGFPALEVSPEGFFGRAIGKLTNRDIQLESEEFNRAFTVVSADRRFAYDILHPRLMERLLLTRDVGWKIQQGWILAVEPGRHDVTDIDRRLAVIDGVLDAVPDFVRQQYGLPPAGTAGQEGTA
ncbi:MAG: DUF3137 domain-containing protein [Nocardioides sp.]